MGTGVQPVRTSRYFDSRRRKHKSPLDKAKAYEVIWDEVSYVFDAARLCDNACFVYVIGEEDGPIKIGLSKDPIARLRTMQTGNPRRLCVERVLIGDMAIEKLLHELWEPFAVASAGTEWFKAEARETLLPIIAEAARRQVEHSYDTDVSFASLEQIVRAAHAESGFVAKGRDEIHLLAQGAGIVIRNRSRI